MSKPYINYLSILGNKMFEILEKNFKTIIKKESEDFNSKEGKGVATISIFNPDLYPSQYPENIRKAVNELHDLMLNYPEARVYFSSKGCRNQSERHDEYTLTICQTHEKDTIAIDGYVSISAYQAKNGNPELIIRINLRSFEN